ncbi:hypothetical protein [Streptomyces nanshensis]|uniref:Uncharacterized protein n=1 Tax=Streptomyces nanshensis TaxID=518642 RepID=A0A1E7LA49_9ACTN|nr:hypothetical protein [Streptomyces nanshensis]OEV13020.1 hypothetical protein AN218_05805 [Streptomyces nanshensis]
MALTPEQRREQMNKLTPKWVPLSNSDQLDLEALAKELMAARAHKGERITANTLIRIGVKAVLRHQSGLAGDTEAELREKFLAYLSGEDQHRDGTHD